MAASMLLPAWPALRSSRPAPTPGSRPPVTPAGPRRLQFSSIECSCTNFLFDFYLHFRLRQFGFEGDQVPDFRRPQTNHHRVAHIGQEADVEYLGDVAFETDPLLDVTVGQRNDLHAAPGFDIALGQLGIQLQTLETLVPGFGQAHRRGVAEDGQAAHEAGQERQRHEGFGLEIYPAQITGAGIEQPQLAVGPARRMRHRQAFADDLVGQHVDHHAAIVAPVAPTIHGVALAHGSDIAGLAIDHGQAVEVATVFRRELADEVRFPDRLEAVRLAQLGQAGVLRVDEDDLAVLADAKFMDVEVA